MSFTKTFRAASLAGATLAVLMGTLVGAQASIMDHGSYLTDTTTSMDWLDLTATQGLSYSSVIGSPPAGGWHYASLADVSTLFDDAGGTGPYDFTGGNGLVGVQGAATSLLRGLMGDTSPLGYPGGWGLTSDVDPSGGCCGPYPHFLAMYLDLPPTTNYLLVPFGTQGDNASDLGIGSLFGAEFRNESSGAREFGAVRRWSCRSRGASSQGCESVIREATTHLAKTAVFGPPFLFALPIRSRLTVMRTQMPVLKDNPKVQLVALTH